MSSKKKPRRGKLSEEEIDNTIEAHAGDDSKWGTPIRVRKKGSASLSIPAELAARAAFLARLHREENVVDWLTRIIKERVEMEEVAFIEAKRELSARRSV